MFNNLVALSKDYSEMQFPKLDLEVISTQEYAKSPLHFDYKPSIQATNHQKNKKYDMVVDISMTEKDDAGEVSFSEFQCNNNCYFNIRSANSNMIFGKTGGV